MRQVIRLDQPCCAGRGVQAFGGRGAAADDDHIFHKARRGGLRLGGRGDKARSEAERESAAGQSETSDAVR